MTGKMTETILTVFWALGVLSSGRLHSTLNTADSGGNDSPRLIPKDDLLPSDGLSGNNPLGRIELPIYREPSRSPNTMIHGPTMSRRSNIGRVFLGIRAHPTY